MADYVGEPSPVGKRARGAGRPPQILNSPSAGQFHNAPPRRISTKARAGREGCFYTSYANVKRQFIHLDRISLARGSGSRESTASVPFNVKTAFFADAGSRKQMASPSAN
jgi:hypothetical protein